MIPIEKRRWIKDGKKKLAVIRTRQEEQEEQIANDILAKAQAKAADKLASKAKVQKFYDDEMKDIKKTLYNIKKTASKAKVCMYIYYELLTLFLLSVVTARHTARHTSLSKCFVFSLSLFTEPLFFFLLFSSSPLSPVHLKPTTCTLLFLSFFFFSLFTIITERHRVDGQC